MPGMVLTCFGHVFVRVHVFCVLLTTDLGSQPCPHPAEEGTEF